MISVLVPYKADNGHRDRLAAWTLERWEKLVPEAEVIYGNSPEPFNRAQARNHAFAASRGDMIVVADADTVFRPDLLETAVQMVASGHAQWVLPYDVYFNCTVADTLAILERDPASEVPDPEQWDFRLTTSISGVVVMPRAAWEAVGGYDERFVGWGGEDNAFAHALDTLWGPHRRLTGSVLHLWHPRGDGDFHQPGWPQNLGLRTRYEQARGRPDRMQMLVDERA